MTSDDLAGFLAPPSKEFGYHQGTVISWDALTGNNAIRVNGRDLVDLDILATSDSVFLSPGDAVLLLRFRSNMCILGRISKAGTGALGVRTISAPATGYVTTAGTYGDLSIGAGPTLSNVFIPSSRRCIVILSAAVYAAADNDGAAHFQVTGASTIAAPTGPSAFSEGAFLGAASGGAAVEGTATRQFVLTSADGLNSGFNTFTVKYMARTVGVDDTFFSDRVITVIPF